MVPVSGFLESYSTQVPPSRSRSSWIIPKDLSEACRMASEQHVSTRSGSAPWATVLQVVALTTNG